MDFLLRNLVIFAIAPCVGAWIEVVVSIKQTPPVVSHPTWVRGLKKGTPHSRYFSDELGALFFYDTFIICKHMFA